VSLRLNWINNYREVKKMKKDLDLLLSELGKGVGIEELALDKEDGCVLSFDELVVSLQYVPDNNSLVLFSNLGVLDGQDLSGQFAEMLEANFYERARGGPTIGYHRETKTAWTIYQTAVGPLDFPAFEEKMERFVNFSEAWKKRFMDPEGLASDKTSPSDQTIPPGIRA
jgi:hypothetical protein